jgi:hypothetical protein
MEHQIYINNAGVEDKTAYSSKVYDITTDLESIKNYMGVDSSLQRAAFSVDLTDYALVIDDS